jgi:hypothetical protein
MRAVPRAVPRQRPEPLVDQVASGQLLGSAGSESLVACRSGLHRHA